MEISNLLGERNDYIENIYEDPEHDFYIQIPYNYIKPKDYPQGYMKVYFGNNLSRISFFVFDASFSLFTHFSLSLLSFV